MNEVGGLNVSYFHWCEEAETTQEVQYLLMARLVFLV
jgi:hypothetical protein